MANLTASRARISSIDLLRGIVMVIMALDHVRDFFHKDAFMHDPLDPQTTTPALFFTRWVTHFCAPIFLFLAGTSAYLMSLKKTKTELGSFLIKRGLWLIVVEVVFVTLAITFNPFYNTLILQVIWATGISMVILGLMVRLPYKLILIIGIAIVFGHNLLDYPEAAHGHKMGFWWDLIHSGNFSMYPYAKDHAVLILYAFLPWTGIMLIGYCMGKLFSPAVSSAQRKKMLLYSGFGLIALFVVLRLINGYGDPVPWTTQRNAGHTFLSFLNVNKYPPSLMYISITLGPGLVFLALAEHIQNKITDIFIVFGRTPFFYYVIHFYLIHVLVTVAFFLAGCGAKDIFTPGFFFYFRPKQFGFDLWVVYVVWFIVILIMYPLCKKYDRYKSTHRTWWLSYL